MKIILWTRPVTTIAAQIDSKTLFNTDLKKKKSAICLPCKSQQH